MHKNQKIKLLIKKLRQLLPSATIALRYSNDWELLVAVMLSAQTTDKKVNEVTAKLFKKYITVDDYASADPKKLARDIRSVNYCNTKARHIIATANIILEKFGGKVPGTMDELITLKGVGRKTANVVLCNAFNNNQGIAVDTHVMRLGRLFGLSRHKDPEKIERNLIKLIPERERKNFTYRIIAYGRQYCTARCRHEKCPLRMFIVKTQKR